MLGNLYREKGQVGRAIQEHQSLLQRPRLNKVEHANVLLCIGLDYRRGGFVDRAVAAFSDVLKLDPENEAALINLEKLQEDQHQWHEVRHEKAACADRRTARSAEVAIHPGVSRNELGLQAFKAELLDEAARRFEAAIDLDSSVSPAYVHLGDVRLRQGDLAGAVAIWERSIDVTPDRAYLALERLEQAYGRMGAEHRFTELPAAHRRRATRVAGTNGSRAHSPPRTSPRARSSCCSRRSSTTRTPSPFTR